MGDEISGGAPAPARHPARTALIVLAAAAVVVAGIVSLRRGVDPPAVSAPASPPAAQMPRPPGQLAPPEPELELVRLCHPVRTDGHSMLTVAFTLRNIAAEPVNVVKVIPLLFPGLRWVGTQIQDGTCGAPGADLGVVPEHGTALATLHLELPPTCPAPIPIEVTVTEQHADGRLVDGRVHLLDDLGGIHFSTC